jgi:alpha-L-rhamnosidase
MKHLYLLALSILSIFLFKTSVAQTAGTEETSGNKPWNSHWIGAPFDFGKDYGVYYYRKNIDLTNKPSTFMVHVSADNRYKLYVNGTLVSLGPRTRRYLLLEL